MKTENEVRAAMVSHLSNMEAMKKFTEMPKKISQDLGWSEDYLAGYQAGVMWAYQWVLDEAPRRRKNAKA